ncbi:hypothetical protein GCM10027043_40230 [Ferruginibacter profundus]
MLIVSAFSLKNFAQSSPTDFPVSIKNTPILTDTVFVNYLTDFYTDLNIKSKNMDKIKSIAVANTISEKDLNEIY